MSGFGGFGGFGQNNNQQQQSTGFGGFGASTNTNTGFGAPANTGFGSGASTTGGSLFGGGGGSTGGFGTSGGFGTNNNANNNNAFGAPKPGGFGTNTTTSGGSLFGASTATAGSTGFGGFGANNAATTSSPFGGAANSGGGLFGGGAKPAFGGAATSSPFGGAATSSPFGGGSTTSAFGAPTSTALGGATGDCQGTGSVPFQAFVEKEPNSSSNQQNSFQSISFQQPYSKFSPEELRLADYSQGRRYGNGSNQAGAFGTTNFSSFGGTSNTSTGFGAQTASTGNSLFGGGAATSSPFGTSQPATNAFGTASSTTGGGLFGAPKPATGGLFGAQTQAQQSGGLFGTSGGTGGAFGTSGGAFGTNTNTNTGSSLFGGNSNSTPKPAFSFGNSTPASTSTGFGTTPTASNTFGGGGGGLFGGGGQQPAASPFGGQQQTQQQQPASNPFGGFGNANQNSTGTTSLFGGANNQPKPAGGLFGAPAANTGTGLFGGAQPATNAFGGAGNQNSGGLFGPKPAATGTGLFGGTQNSGGGLFGNNTQNQNQNQGQQNTSSLFGGLNNNNNQQPKPSLFGGAQQTGGGLFGASQPQQQGGGLFGGSTNNQQQQQQPQNSLFGGGSSIFSGSQQGQQNSQSLTTNISDNAAFGSSSLFSNLGATQNSNPGPIATPLASSVNKQKKSAAIPIYKLNSASTSSRFTTPQKRGFGFSYSTYGTPNSASSTASTPGTFGGSTLGGTFGRTLSKSVSTSNLRRSFNTEDSILAPGAFSASPNARHFGSTGSVKKLVINRGLRNDLFSPPNPQQQPSAASNSGILKKRVSFDSNPAVNANNTLPSPLKQVHSNASPASEDLGYLRPRNSTNGGTSNGVKHVENKAPEMEQVSNNELAIVHEEDTSPSQHVPEPVSQKDLDPGRYWMKPTKEEIENMNRVQRGKVVGFTVGRDGIGQIRFDAPVDLTAINLDEILGDIVQLNVRSATVYSNPAKKPPMGKGLNLPSTISLLNSWPRKKDLKTPSGDRNGARFKKHIDRLEKVPDTEFVGYDSKTGIWTFKVKHFTTYGFPEDDEENDGEGLSEFGQSTLSAPPDTPTPQTQTPKNFDQSFASTSQFSRTESDPEDTFEFRRKKILPGAFDDEGLYEDEDMDGEYDQQDQESFLDERSVGSQSENGVDEPMDQDDVFDDNESVSIVDQEMAGSYPEIDNTAELDEVSQDDDDVGSDVMETPGAILRARMRAARNSGTPSKPKFTAGNDWTSALRTTVSPQKQDRALLKSLIDVHGNDSRPDTEPTPVPKRVVSDGRGFATSIDLMNSLFGQTRSPAKFAKVPTKDKGFEWPYAKRTKTNDDQSNMSEIDSAFHDSMKPSWGPDGTLVYAAPPNSKPFGRSSRRIRERDGLLVIKKDGVVSESRDVRFAKFSNEAAADLLQKHKDLTIINIDGSDIPFASIREDFSFSDFVDDRTTRDPAATHEKLVWQLASVLFDPVDIPEDLAQVPKITQRIRKETLSSFWQKLVDEASAKHVALSRTNEEKAIAALSGYRIADACGHLIAGKDFHLATLVALIGHNDGMRKDIQEQLRDWQKSRVLAEFDQPIRAIYELLAGNVCVCSGTKGAPVEDRIDSFVISKRFGLDWRQAFGLRLWYGIRSTESVKDAIAAFAEDIGQDLESAFPHSWYVEQNVPKLWHDEGIKEREDLLWGLLKLYTFHDADLEAALRPENSQLSPLDVRLSWQLSQTLVAADVRSYGENAEEKADQITLDFASQLTNEGTWLDAVFVLLHLSSPSVRTKAIQDHIAHHAGLIGSEDSSAFTTLTQNFKISASWIWEAKALYMRSIVKDPRAEVECLIKAGSFNEAHRTFARDVAPKTIIELNHDVLRVLLAGFQGKESSISEWHLGGEIYQDYLELLDSQKRSLDIDHSVLQRLLSSLPAVVEEARGAGFMERVAIETISGVVAKAVVAMAQKGEKNYMRKVLQLPLTEDKYLKHTVELSIEYYREVMAAR